MVFLLVLFFNWVQRYGVDDFYRQPIDVHPHGPVWLPHILGPQAYGIGDIPFFARHRHEALLPVSRLQDVLCLICIVMCIVPWDVFSWADRYPELSELACAPWVIASSVGIAGLRHLARRRLRALKAGQFRIYLSGDEVLCAHLKLNHETILRPGKKAWRLFHFLLLTGLVTLRVGEQLGLPANFVLWLLLSLFCTAGVGWILAPVWGWDLYLAQQARATAEGRWVMAPSAPRRAYLRRWMLGAVSNIALAGLLWWLLPIIRARLS